MLTSSKIETKNGRYIPVSYADAIKTKAVYKIDPGNDELDGGRLIVLNEKTVFALDLEGEICTISNTSTEFKKFKFLRIEDEIITITIDTTEDTW